MTSVEASSRLHRWLLDPLGRLVARLADAMSHVIAGRRLRASADQATQARGGPGTVDLVREDGGSQR
jgi:hypothetical protein